MNRRTFLKATGMTLMLSSTALATEQEYQWMNVEIQKPPLNERIAILKYSIDIDSQSPRDVANICVGKIIKQVNETMIHMKVEVYYSFVRNHSKRDDYHHVERGAGYDKKVCDFIEKHYSTDGCLMYENLRSVSTVMDDDWWGMHLFNSVHMKAYWAPINRLPKQLPPK